MKNKRNWYLNMKDIIAFLLVCTFCISIFFPSSIVDSETMQVFERILFTVMGFYFGFHSGEQHGKSNGGSDKDTTAD